MCALPKVSILFLFIGNSAWSALVEYEFSGYLNRKEDPDGYASQFDIGDDFSGFFSFDTEDLFRSNVEVGREIYRSPSYKSALDLEGTIFQSTDDQQIQVFNDYFGFDEFFFSSSWIYEAIPLPDGVFTQFRIELRDETASLYDSLDFPGSLELGDFDSPIFGLTGYSSPSDIEFHLGGVITQLRIVSVPEPSTVGSSASFFLVAVVFARRMRRMRCEGRRTIN